ncbi:hypothetical protein [Janibacter melonis]|uniref:hypothetical protein n=1 Tax=Janibacter melonis TaxID=262209 RepID=UPI00191872B0|nr:hypothetical protein [Janibacter melonis]
MTNRTVQAGQPLSFTAEQVAGELGLAKPSSETWEFDTVKSSLPAGITLAWNAAHGTVDVVERGAYAVQVFYASSGTYHQMTPYTIYVTPAPALAQPDDLAQLLGWPTGVPTETRGAAERAILISQHAVHAYTRGRGFDHDQTGAVTSAEADIRSVIVTGAARLLSNPTNARRIEAGSYNSAPGMFEGWSLVELAVLHRYRVRANALAMSSAGRVPMQ